MGISQHIIVTDIPRPSPELVAKVAKQYVGLAGYEAGPRQVCHAAIKPLDPAWKICGPAVTVRADYWFDRMMGELAPKYVKPGDVIVVDAGGYTDVAVWGMSMSTSAKAAGAAGVVIDGSTATAALLIREHGQMPIFTRGVSPAVLTADGPGSINVPVICGGVIVNPGDIILADSDGVVVLKPEMAEAMIRNAEAHDKIAQDPDAAKKPYWERRDVEARLKAMGNVTWR